MYLYPYKIFAMSKNKRLFNRGNPYRTVGIYDVECMTYDCAKEVKEDIDDSCISVLLGEVKKGLYLNVLDLDDCLLEDGSIEPETKDLLSYFDDDEWEFSSSGTGIHIYVLTTKKYNTFIVKELQGCKSFEFYADKRHIVTTTFDFENVSLPINKYNGLLDGIKEEVEKKRGGATVKEVMEVFDGKEIKGDDEQTYNQILLGRTPVTSISKIRELCVKDTYMRELIDMNPESVDQSAHDASLIRKLMYYTLSFDSAWDMAMKTNYYQAKDMKHKKKFNDSKYKERTRNFIERGTYASTTS